MLRFPASIGLVNERLRQSSLLCEVLALISGVALLHNFFLKFASKSNAMGWFSI